MPLYINSKDYYSPDKPIPISKISEYKIDTPLIMNNYYVQKPCPTIIVSQYIIYANTNPIKNIDFYLYCKLYIN